MKKSLVLVIFLSLMLILASCSSTPEETKKSKKEKQTTEQTEEMSSGMEAPIASTTGPVESSSEKDRDKDKDKDDFITTTPLLKAIKPELEEGDHNYVYEISLYQHAVHAYGGFWFIQEEKEGESTVYFNPDEGQNDPFKVCTLPFSRWSNFALLPTNRGRDLYIFTEFGKLLHYDLVNESFREPITAGIPYSYESLGVHALSFAVTDDRICILSPMYIHQDKSLFASNLEKMDLSVLGLETIDTRNNTIVRTEPTWMNDLPAWVLEGQLPEADKPAVFAVCGDIGLCGPYRYYFKREVDFAKGEFLPSETDGIYRCRWDQETEEEFLLPLSDFKFLQLKEYEKSFVLSNDYLLILNLNDERHSYAIQSIGGTKTLQYLDESTLAIRWLEGNTLWYGTHNSDNANHEIHFMDLTSGRTEKYLAWGALNTSIELTTAIMFYPYGDNVLAGDENHLYRISRTDPRRDYELVFQTEKPLELRFVTGGEAGTYYAFGTVIAQHATNNIGTKVTALVGVGSKGNVNKLQDKEAELAFCQSDIMAYAYQGTNLFEKEGKVENLSVLGALYVETVQLVAVNPDIKSVEDLKGKNVSVGAAGSAVYFNALNVLSAYGMTMDDIKPYYQSFGDSANELKDGKIDAAFIVAGAPTTAVVDLAATNPNTHLISFDEEHLNKLLAAFPYYTKSVIKGSTYSIIAEDVTTIGVGAVLLVRDDIPEEVVYKLTKDIFENPASLVSSHTKYGEVTVEYGASMTIVPYHKGAARYFAEKGIFVPTK